MCDSGSLESLRLYTPNILNRRSRKLLGGLSRFVYFLWPHKTMGVVLLLLTHNTVWYYYNFYSLILMLLKSFFFV